MLQKFLLKIHLLCDTKRLRKLRHKLRNNNFFYHFSWLFLRNSIALPWSFAITLKRVAPTQRHFGFHDLIKRISARSFKCTPQFSRCFLVTSFLNALSLSVIISSGTPLSQKMVYKCWITAVLPYECNSWCHSPNLEAPQSIKLE